MAILNDYDYWGDDDNDSEVIFMLVSDDDDNWYVINEEDEESFNEWVEIMHTSENNSELPFDDCMVDLHSLRFYSYWEE